MIYDELKARFEEQTARFEEQKEEILNLKQQLQILRKALFASTSERHPLREKQPEEIDLFDNQPDAEGTDRRANDESRSRYGARGRSESSGNLPETRALETYPRQEHWKPTRDESIGNLPEKNQIPSTPKELEECVV